MQQYDEYKNSPIRFVSEIPRHWTVKRFKYLFNLTKGLNITKSNLQISGIPCISYGEIHSHCGFEVIPDKNNLKCVNDDYLESSPKSLLNKGDFVFADTSEDIDGSGNFTHLDNDETIFAGYHTIIASLKENINYKYLAYFFDSISFRSQIREQVKGVKVYSITNAILKDTLVFLPSMSEQIAIADFLNSKIKEMDKLILEKEQLLSLYKEEIESIINQSVTKGLDLNVSMQDTKIPWLGEIPSHWEITKLKYIGKSIIGLTYKPDEVVNTNGKLVLRSSNIQNGQFCSKDSVYLDKEIPEKLIVKKGDILICSRNGSKALIGKNITIDEKLEGNTFGAFMTVFRTEYYEFVSKYFNSQIFNGQSGLFLTSTINQLTISTLKNFFIALPPEDERKEIVEFINNQTKEIEEKISKTKNVIALQKEYRQALINEVVTGKIKVVGEV